jgi:hypothetical protein
LITIIASNKERPKTSIKMLSLFIFIVITISLTRPSDAFLIRPIQHFSKLCFGSSRINAIVPSGEKIYDSLMYDYFTKPRILERTSIFSILYGQGLLLGIGLFSGIICNNYTLQLNSDTFIFGLLFAVPMLGTLCINMLLNCT